MKKPAKSISLCLGCRDDFYNGKNPLGVKQCWLFKEARVAKRLKVGVNDRPPYDLKRAAWTLHCHKPQGYVQVPLESLTEEGYWRSWKDIGDHERNET